MTKNELSPQMRSYLLGLYLADGSLRAGASSCVLQFYLQGNELELARAVKKMLKTMAFKTRIGVCRSYMINVYSKFEHPTVFFPHKKELSENHGAAERFLDNNGLRQVEYAIPFIAGLIDGDGNCKILRVVREGNGGFFGHVNLSWKFTQKRCGFLIDYVESIVGSIAVNGSSIFDCGNGKRIIQFKRNGRDSLLHFGIAEYSWKIARWLSQLKRLRKKLDRERLQFVRSSKVALALGVHAKTVRARCRRGMVRRRKSRRSQYYIYASEVPRLLKAFGGDLTQQGYITTCEASARLGVGYQTVWRYCKQGKLKATLWRGRYMISREDLERHSVKAQKGHSAHC